MLLRFALVLHFAGTVTRLALVLHFTAIVITFSVSITFCGDCHYINHKNYNFLACDWFKNVLFSTNSLAKLLSDSLLLDRLLDINIT